MTNEEIAKLGTVDGTKYGKEIFEDYLARGNNPSGALTPWYGEADASSGWYTAAGLETSKKNLGANAEAYCVAFAEAAKAESLRLHRAAMAAYEAEQAAMIREGEYRADREGTENL